MRVPGFPPGYRINPDDEAVLILEYLCPKVCDPQGFRPDVVPECDLYDEEEKWKAWFECIGESQLYFFTQLKKKSKEKGKRVERSFGETVWKSQREDLVYLDPSCQTVPIGYKRTFSYKVKKKPASSSRSSENNVWVMHEFRLYEDLAEWLGVNGDHDYVICCVRKKEERNSSNGQLREFELIDAAFDAFTINKQ